MLTDPPKAEPTSLKDLHCGREEAPGWAQVLFLPPPRLRATHFHRDFPSVCRKLIPLEDADYEQDTAEYLLRKFPWLQGPRREGGEEGVPCSHSCLWVWGSQYLASRKGYMCSEASGKSLLLDRDIQAVLISESLSFPWTETGKEKKRKVDKPQSSF